MQMTCFSFNPDGWFVTYYMKSPLQETESDYNPGNFHFKTIV